MNTTGEWISELVQMRRSAHQFLVGDAPVWFAQREDFIGPMLMPPSLPAAAGAEPMGRLVALAADEAERLGDAALFTLDPGAAAAAVSYGARLQTSAAMDAPAGGATIASHGIVPPAPAGFLRWATPITDDGDPMPVIGVHRGRVTTPATSGIWLAFWSDLRAVLVRRLADVSAPDWLTPHFANNVLASQGSVCYEQADFLQDPDAVQGPEADPARPVFPFTHLRGAPLPPLPADQPDPDDRLIYTVLASWAMLTPHPDQRLPPPHLVRRAVPARESEADRRAGLPPARQVTLVTAPTLRTTDPLPEEVSEGINQLCMRIVALWHRDAPDGPSPDEVIADLLSRYETEVVLMAAYHSGQEVLRMVTEETRTRTQDTRTRRTGVLTQILSQAPAGETLPFDRRAWTALDHLLLARSQEPALPPPGIEATDLLWALGFFQAKGLTHLVENTQQPSDRSKHKAVTRPPTARQTTRSKKRRR